MRTFRTLFSGGELFGVGAQAAGWRHLDGYEIRPDIAAVARRNGFDARAADVCEIDYESLMPVDHLHASPSCKNASLANVKAGETQADLDAAAAICRAIRAHQGATFSLENVWSYRNFESFACILHALHAYGYAVDSRHVNAADYGVPQTRKRLILRAVRGRDRVPPMHPTHRKGGDMLHAKWIGWYAAIVDLIDTLPETTPAPWQLDRLPAELKQTMLFAQNDSKDKHGNSYGATGRAADAPALTIGTIRDGTYPKALLVQSKNTRQEWGDGFWRDDQPAPTVVSDHKPSHMPRAYIVGGGNTQLAQIDSHARSEDEPMFTVSASDGAKKSVAACLLDVGRWVRLTVQALGRFQTVPDSYIGLTAEINGNGVPCLLAQRIMESFQ